MEYDDSFLKELRGLGEHIQSHGGAEKITQIVERCIEIKRRLNSLEKRPAASKRNYSASRRKKALFSELTELCNVNYGGELIKAVAETARCYEYFMKSIKMDFEKSL